MQNRKQTTYVASARRVNGFVQKGLTMTNSTYPRRNLLFRASIESVLSCSFLTRVPRHDDSNRSLETRLATLHPRTRSWRRSVNLVAHCEEHPQNKIAHKTDSTPRQKEKERKEGDGTERETKKESKKKECNKTDYQVMFSGPLLHGTEPTPPQPDTSTRVPKIHEYTSTSVYTPSSSPH